MSLFFKKICRGTIGIGFHDSGMTIGQCTWQHGAFLNAKVKYVDVDPVDLSADDWRISIGALGLQGADSVISIANSMIHCQVLRLPEMSETECKKAAAWELADRFKLERSALQTDVIPLGNSGEILSVGINIELLETLLEPMYSAGLRPSLVEPQFVSDARLFSMLHQRENDKAQVRSILDFGLHKSTFTVLAGDEIVFYKSLEYCGDSLIQAIETNTGVSTKQAKQMLVGINNEEEDPAIIKAVQDATRVTHEGIATEVMRCNRHYGVTSRGPLSSRIIITGSAGWNRYLSSFLEKICNQEVIPDTAEPHISTLPSDVVSIIGWHRALGASLANATIGKQYRTSDRKQSEAA